MERVLPRLVPRFCVECCAGTTVAVPSVLLASSSLQAAWVVQFFYSGLEPSRVPVNNFSGYGPVSARTWRYDSASR
jgi:hypothetical protein